MCILVLIYSKLLVWFQGKQIKSFHDDGNDNLLSEIHQKFNYRHGERIKFLEHVAVTVNIQCKRRGNIEIFLLSPQNTNVKILQTRRHDNSTAGFQNWTFMSVATWSENPQGKWLLIIRDVNGTDTINRVGKSKLRLYGTRTNPNNLHIKF